MLPKLEIDDVLVFENMGAYSLTIATQFNGVPFPEIDYFIQNKFL